jgi:site-specific DNA-methyltransferase (adenine-specific)
MTGRPLDPSLMPALAALDPTMTTEAMRATLAEWGYRTRNNKPLAWSHVAYLRKKFPRPQPNILNTIIHGDFLRHVENIATNSVDLVVTSPPYALQRKEFYDSISEDDYPRWTVEWMSKVKRVLKPNGSVMINIRPHLRQGQISAYVHHTILALRDDGWRECDTWVWYKPDGSPHGHSGRPRRTYELLHWFSLAEQPFCDPKSSAGKLSKKIGLEDKRKGLKRLHHGITKGRYEGLARAPDVIVAPIGGVEKSADNDHPAQFPTSLAEQIIEILCPQGGTVLDPFIGVGTTAVAAIRTGRMFIGTDTQLAFVRAANKRIARACEEALARASGGVFKKFNAAV